MDIEQLQQEKRDIKKLLSDKIDKIDEQIKVEKERLAIIEEKKLLDIIKYENKILYLKAKTVAVNKLISIGTGSYSSTFYLVIDYQIKGSSVLHSETIDFNNEDICNAIYNKLKKEL